jgi:hypothetical protein
LKNLNLVLFTISLFQLKSVHIYMDETLTTEEQVHKALTKMRWLRCTYLVAIILHLISYFILELIWGKDELTLRWYAKYNLV